MDEESRALYDARFRYYIDRDKDTLEERIAEIIEPYRNTFRSYLDSYFRLHPEKKGLPFAIFGAGGGGKRTIRTLKLLGHKICGIYDNSSSLQGTDIYGFKVKKPGEALAENKEFIAYVGVAYSFQLELFYQLRNSGIREENICMYPGGSLYIDLGNQYFDLEAMTVDSDGEVFVDAGCYDGLSSVGAAKWSGGG